MEHSRDFASCQALERRQSACPALKDYLTTAGKSARSKISVLFETDVGKIASMKNVPELGS